MVAAAISCAFLASFIIPDSRAWLLPPTTRRSSRWSTFPSSQQQFENTGFNKRANKINVNDVHYMFILQRERRAIRSSLSNNRNEAGSPSSTVSAAFVAGREQQASKEGWERSKNRLSMAGDAGDSHGDGDSREKAVTATAGVQHGAEAASADTMVDESKEDGNRQGPGLKKQLQLLAEMSTPFFKEDTGARWLLAGVVALTLLNSGVSVAFSYIGRDFWTALSNRDPEQFNIMLQRFLVALAAGVPVTVFYRYQRSALALAWREWMTKRVMQIYYNGQTYYALEASKEIDNPDQRIAEDVRAFTQVSLEFLITILTSCIDLASFSTILYSIYPELFVAIIGYASIGTFVTTKLGGKLVGLNFDQLQTEADFRYSLIRVRENAESIAFYGGVQQELKEIRRRFELALDNFGKVIKAQRNLEFFTTSYRYLIQVLPGFVVAPLFFQGKIQLGVVSQSYGAFNHILGDLSLIVNQFESLSAFSAGIDRLGEFLERMQGGLDDSPPAASGQTTEEPTKGQKRELLAAPAAVPSESTLPHEGQSALAERAGKTGIADSRLVTEIVRGAPLLVEDVTVVTPTGGRVLVTGLTFGLKPSERMLIVGESGAGKSSLLRALAGLWTTGSGKIVRPTTEEMFFLPQRPYCTLGPLRDQITYPSSHADTAGVAADETRDHATLTPTTRTTAGETKVSSSGKSSAAGKGLNGEHGVVDVGNRDKDEELLALLEKVDLGKLPALMGNGDPHAGLGAVRDWSDMLSLGEQQRLAFARLLYNKPTLAILDESTSALDLNNEARMFALLDTLPNLSVVSVGHRPSLIRFHDTKLSLTNKGFSIESTGSGRDVARETVGEEYEKERKNGWGIAPIVARGLDGRDGGR